MVFKLVKPTEEMEEQYFDYISEWERTGERVVPYAARRSASSYKDLLDSWRMEATDKVYERGLVPASLYFFVDENKRIYGALHIRHELNDYLLNYGGHIGYGIRPSERQKGYASKMLAASLPIAKGFGIKRTLITCDKENIGSAKTMISNGGILENEVIQDGKVIQRYWIEL